jgi:hypothetical protein
MITPAEIARRAERLYLPFLRAWLQDESLFPQIFPVGKLPSDYLELSAGVARLLKGAKGPHGYGYAVYSRRQQTQRHGLQSLPERILIETERDLLRLIGKEAEFAAFRADVTLIRGEVPQLEEWMARHPERVIKHHGEWRELLRVCVYFLDHPHPACYIRELPIAVHTKFIESHTGILKRLLDALLPPPLSDPHEAMFERRFGLRYDEPLIRMRFLDDELPEQYHLPVSDLSMPVSQLDALELGGHRCLIVENKMTFLTLPPLGDTFAILGGGFHISLLAEVEWLAGCPIYYWGDLDAQGFQILALLRSAFSDVASLMMDEETLAAFREFAVPGTPCAASDLPSLTPAERALFKVLAREQLRLEQERISQTYVIDHLRAIDEPGNQGRRSEAGRI